MTVAREMSTRYSSNKHGGYKVFEDGKIRISLHTYVPNLDIQVLRDGQATTVYSAAYHSHRRPDRLHPRMWVQHLEELYQRPLRAHRRRRQHRGRSHINQYQGGMCILGS